MNEQPRIETPPLQPLGLQGAMRLGLVIVAGMAVLVLLISHDRGERGRLESFSETTAVGDQAYFKAPPRSAPLTTAVVFQGKPLTPVSVRKLELHDSKMAFAGVEDGGTLRIYTSVEPVPMEKGESEAKGRPIYFLKTGINEFIRVQ